MNNADERMRLTTETGTLGLLAHAINGARCLEEYTFSLNGDLATMSAQKSFLMHRHGFDIGQSDVYPRLKEKDIIPALTIIWNSRFQGYWLYHDEYIKYGICTEEEWKNR